MIKKMLIDSILMLQPFIKYIFLLSMLLCIDTVTGVMKAHKKNIFTYLKLLCAFRKIGIFIMAIYSIRISEWIVFGDSLTLLTSASIGYFCVMELKSIMNNCHKMGMPIPPQVLQFINYFDNDRKGE